MTADGVGGVWTYALTLVHGLRAAGVEVVLATMGGALAPGQLVAARRAGAAAVLESGFRLEWMQDPWRDVERAGTWLLRLEEQARPDVVHLNGYSHAVLPWRAPTVVVGHSCVLSWWRAVLAGPAPDEWRTYAERVRAGLAAAGAVVAPTRAMLEVLRAHYGRLPRATVIPNGIAVERWRPLAKEPFLLAAGRLWDRGKNLEMLVRVAPRLPWPLHLAGDTRGPDADDAEIWTAGAVKLLGKLSGAEVAVAMGRAAVFVHPALYEPFGLAPLEAAACGCALLLADIPSLREVWGDAALYLDPRLPGAWVRAAQELARRPHEIERLGARARARAARYSAAATARAYLALYGELLAQRRGEASGEPNRRSTDP